MNVVEAGLAIVALLAGLALGWLLGGRPAITLKSERDAAEARARQHEADLAVARERARDVELVRAMLESVRDERDAAHRALASAEKVVERVGAIELELIAERGRAGALAAEKAAFERGETERALSHEQQIAQLREMEARLNAQFGELAGKALGDAQKMFLERADQRFAQSTEKSEAQLKALLAPVETTLKRYETNLAEVEKARAGSYGELKEAVAQLTVGNEVVRRETQRLTNVLRSSPKARGRWGEEQLRSILTMAGLAENVDFNLQTTIADGERQLRPDCVINLPNQRCIVIDVKCPLVAYEQAHDEEDETRRAALLLQHANAMKSYAADLGRKGYWRQFDLSPDFVIMFIPGEHFLSAAAERAPDLIESAFRNGVIVASTINMLALAKVMAGMWRQESLAEQAKEIAEAGKELYKRLATMGDHVAALGKNLAQASGAYNKFVGSLESQVLTQAKRFETLKVDTQGKTIEPLPVLEGSVRALTKLGVVGADA
jgi:DNA recombination protein RmuC